MGQVLNLPSISQLSDEARFHFSRKISNIKISLKTIFVFIQTTDGVGFRRFFNQAFDLVVLSNWWLESIVKINYT